MTTEDKSDFFQHSCIEYQVSGKTNLLERYTSGFIFTQLSVKQGIKKYGREAELDSIRKIWQSWVLGIKGPNCFKLWCPRLVIIISGSTRAAQIRRDHKQTFQTLGCAPLSVNYKAGFQKQLYSYLSSANHIIKLG